MTGPETSQMIRDSTALVTAIGVVFSIIASLRNGRKIEEVHRATNGLTKQLVEGATREGYTAGVSDEKSGTAPKQ